jgi:hypothetical protein
MGWKLFLAIIIAQDIEMRNDCGAGEYCGGLRRRHDGSHFDVIPEQRFQRRRLSSPKDRDMNRRLLTCQADIGC